jgi:hypothetical protein
MHCGVLPVLVISWMYVPFVFDFFFTLPSQMRIMLDGTVLHWTKVRENPDQSGPKFILFSFD